MDGPYGLASFIATAADRWVIDQTGLGGTYDMTLQFAPLQVTPSGIRNSPDATAPDVGGPPSIFTAVEEQLGLKLVPQTGPVPTLVIDHIEKPSPN